MVDADNAGVDATPGPDVAGQADAALPDAGPFSLTSTAIAEGSMIPDQYTCVGTNLSPPLAWANAPAGTQSFAIVFRDLDFMSGFIHWVIWDIPPGTAGLPEDVENQPNPSEVAGAKQCRSYDGSTYGYLGPCSGGSINTYEFTLYALDVTTLPNVTTDSSRASVTSEILLHVIDSTTLSGEH